jgi:hypothetical protein
VHHLNIGAYAAEFALDVHQAAHITAHHHIRAGIHNVFDFIRHHGIRDIGIYHRKRAEEWSVNRFSIWRERLAIKIISGKIFSS